MRGETPEVPPEELLRRVQRGEVQILDVRTPAEFRGGHIDGAVNVPIGQLEDAADNLSLDPSRPVVAVCLTAHRSIGAVRLLQRKGYDIVQLEGGMRAWRKADLPESKAKKAKAKKAKAKKSEAKAPNAKTPNAKTPKAKQPKAEQPKAE